MVRIHRLILCLLGGLAACRGGDLPGTAASGVHGASDGTDGPTQSDGSFSDTATQGADVDPDVHTFVPEDWPLEAPGRIVFLGDSITVGAGASDDSLDYLSLLLSNDNSRYSSFDGWDLSSEFGDIPAYDASMGGATTDTVLDIQLPAIMEALSEPIEGPTIVIGTIGGNDVSNVVFGLQDLADERERIAANVDAIATFFLDEQRFPDGAMVFLTNVYEPTDGLGQADACFFGLDVSGIQDDFDALNADTLSRAQEHGWSWVDLRGHFLGHGHNHDVEDSSAYHPDDPSLWLARDCIHPNDRGHHEVRRLFLSAIDNRALPR